MYNTKNLRSNVRSLILAALNDAGVTGFEVVHGIEKNDKSHYIVFAMQDVTNMDERSQLDLELNCVGPMSDSDNVEKATDAVIGYLDKRFFSNDDVAFYLYKSTRNRVDGSDPHSVRYRCNFDLYLYERN